VDLFQYDYDELAQQVQHGLERVTISFLRAHGARLRRDQTDFHGKEYVELELHHGQHSLTVRQTRAAPPPGADLSLASPPPLDEFESSFDGWPAANTPAETIAAWLRSLPAGEAPAERPAARPEPTNPFLQERPGPRSPGGAPARNPFLAERPARPPAENPFAADDDRERQRQELLRRLRGDQP
jgi:hypothetical protein